jgi:S23 ribosomal protein.
MRDYKKYDIWKIAHELVKEIYVISENFPKSELFGLTSQIRRASVSIPTNIAEGCGRVYRQRICKIHRNKHRLSK